MLITKNALPRRTFLRGAGAALALPLLDAMVPALTPIVHTAAKPTPRLGFFYVPNGMHMPAWKPKVPGAGTAFELSLSLTGLQPLKEHVTVLSGLNNYAANSVAAATPHVRNQAAWLSGVLARQGAPEARLGMTADQYAANVLGEETVHPVARARHRPGRHRDVLRQRVQRLSLQQHALLEIGNRPESHGEQPGRPVRAVVRR